MAVATYTKSGNKAQTAAKLDKAVFGVVPKDHSLIKQAYTAYLSNARQNNAVVKTRGLVSGGGRKPWRQKGTGRARFGSIRNPIWRGGGVVFGPTGLENHTKKLPLKAKRQAIRQALTIASQSGKIIVIESFDIKDGKTKSAAELLGKIKATRNTLIVVADKTDSTMNATGNLARVKLIRSNYVNVYDVMNADHVVITNEALNQLTEWLGGGDK